MEIPEQIYVVGFPKSGNTWLTRLLADALQAPVHSHSVRGVLEVASEINQHLSLSSDPAFKVMKNHFLPEVFFEEINHSPKKIAYIYRDFRDILVSAFFYFKYKGDEADARMRDVLSLLSLLSSQGPGALYRHYCVRRRMLAYVRTFCQEGVKDDFGTWQGHISAWKTIKDQRSDIKLAFISYEELLNNTASTLLHLFKMLKLPQPNDEKLEEVIGRQSFERLKKRYQNMPSDVDVPYGKEFNVSFLRKGVAGDWKNFISKNMGRIIEKHTGEMLSIMGYESNPHWYESLPSSLF